MKIRTQFIITMILFSAMLLFFFTSAIITQRKLERLDEQRNLAHRLERGTTDLSYLSSAYLLHRETQQRVRWNTEYSSFSNDLSRLTPEDPEQQELVNNITENLERMKAVFTDITASLERMPRDQGPGAVPARIQVSWSRIAVQSRAMLSDASRLSRLLQGQADRLMDRRTNLIFSLMALFVVFLLFYYVLIYRRTLRAISALRTGTRIIGAGNLEYTLTPKHNDEVGELFHAVNRMTASLREVTASKAAFEKEVSGRKRAEEEVSAIARFPSENPHPVLRLNSDGLILFANAASAPVLDQWRTTVGGQAPAPWPDTTRGALISQSGTTVELGCGDRTYGVFVAPVPEAGYVNLYTSDITDRKRAETALRQLNTELEKRVTERTVELARAVKLLEQQAQQLRTLTAELTLAEQRERRRLADMLHDELQQLLVATRLRAHMLGRAEDTQVRQGSQEIVELIEEALAATRTLTAELSPPTLRNGNLLPALEWLIKWVGEKHHLTVHLAQPPPSLPRLPENTAVLVYQCVRELLLNTVKHARVDAADVTVAHDAAGVTLTVADAGVGFAPRSLRVAGGAEGGFGLLGIRERLESVGGRLEIASAPGEGSRFTLTVPVPVVPEEGVARRPLAAPRGEIQKVSPAAPRLRVLVVDDHALVRRGFATMLAVEPDLEVVGEADNGRQAIELTRQLAPDVILMDVSMPVMNGIDATRAIHAEFPALRVIGLSMFDDPEQPETMRQAGAVAFLSKHDSAEALLAAVRGGGAPAA
jgi:signal transduction histidine kinase/ActR/RegA family two-component response regulator